VQPNTYRLKTSFTARSEPVSRVGHCCRLFFIRTKGRLSVQTQVETVLPIYIVGDSHALPYRNLVFREKWTGAWVMARSKYIPGLTAHDFFDPSTGDFNAEFIGFMEYEGLIRAGRATHLSTNEIDFAIAKAAGQSVRPPLILITVGEIDVRGPIMRNLKDTHDFVPPFATALPLLDRPLVPWDVIEQAIDARLAPLIAGLQQLIAAGFTRIYIQSVVPPTRKEDRIRELQGYDCPTTVRTKLVHAFNWKLSAQCQSINVPLLDNWPDLTVDGLLRPEFDFDGVHLPPKAARGFLEALIDHAIDSRGLVANHPRYELYYRIACGQNPFRMPTPSAA
jgi:lysophospholipase L1-like esterase